QMRLAQSPPFEKTWPVAVERAIEIVRNLAVDQRCLIAPAAFGHSQQRQTARRPLGNIASLHRHCHGWPPCGSIFAVLRYKQSKRCQDSFGPPVKLNYRLEMTGKAN